MAFQRFEDPLFQFDIVLPLDMRVNCQQELECKAGIRLAAVSQQFIEIVK